VNGSTLGCVDGTPLVDRVTDNVDDTAQSFFADGDPDGSAGVKDLTVKISNVITAMNQTCIRSI
jgi:hypothetical protein